MNNDYDKLEEKLKEKTESKEKRHKVSGRSVFVIKKIIEKKSEEKEGDGHPLDDRH